MMYDSVGFKLNTITRVSGFNGQGIGKQNDSASLVSWLNCK